MERGRENERERGRERYGETQEGERGRRRDTERGHERDKIRDITEMHMQIESNVRDKRKYVRSKRLATLT